MSTELKELIWEEFGFYITLFLHASSGESMITVGLDDCTLAAAISTFAVFDVYSMVAVKNTYLKLQIDFFVSD